MQHDLQALKREATAASFAVDAANEKLRRAVLKHKASVEHPALHSGLEDCKNAVYTAQREVDAAKEKFRRLERAYQTAVELPGIPNHFTHQLGTSRHETDRITTDC